MTISEYYKNYKANKKMKIALPVNNDVTVKDFYDNCISHNILPRDSVLAWHNMFMEYVERPDAIFWVRYYESGNKNSGRWNTRRGCKTQFKDGFSYVFVSNYDAHEIFNMVRLGVTPSVDEFLTMMKNYEFPLHYDSGKSCEESDIACYPHIGSTMEGILTQDHWYLAHIVGVKSQYVDYLGNELNVDANKLYPRGVVSDWKADENGRKVRTIDDTLSQDEKALVKAHFLRFVDPLNYYAAPGTKYQTNSVAYSIGEEKVLNDYMGCKFADIYDSKSMQAFRRKALAPIDLQCDKDAEINVSYGQCVKANKTKTSSTKQKKLANKSTNSTATPPNNVVSPANMNKFKNHTEYSFFDYMIKRGKLKWKTAKQYISALRKIKPLEELIVEDLDKYIDDYVNGSMKAINSSSHNTYSCALKRLAEYKKAITITDPRVLAKKNTQVPSITIKDFIGKTVFNTATKTHNVIVKITSPYIEVREAKANQYGTYAHYRYECINGDPITNGTLVFEDDSLTESFKKAYSEHCRSKDAYWENYGYYMRKD